MLGNVVKLVIQIFRLVKFGVVDHISKSHFENLVVGILLQFALKLGEVEFLADKVFHAFVIFRVYFKIEKIIEKLFDEILPAQIFAKLIFLIFIIFFLLRFNIEQNFPFLFFLGVALHDDRRFYVIQHQIVSHQHAVAIFQLGHVDHKIPKVQTLHEKLIQVELLLQHLSEAQLALHQKVAFLLVVLDLALGEIYQNLDQPVFCDEVRHELPLEGFGETGDQDFAGRAQQLPKRVSHVVQLTRHVVFKKQRVFEIVFQKLQSCFLLGNLGEQQLPERLHTLETLLVV